MKNFETYDVWLSAYLQLSYRPPQLHLKNQKVVFVFQQSDILYKLLTDFYSNVDVPISDYVSTVKTLRGQMLGMRNNAGG